MSDVAWRALDDELDRWAAAGRQATFWLRDDDAVEATPALERLLAMAADGGAPLALAVIPAGAKSSLADRLAATGAVSVLQHGFAHANHAPMGAKKSEFADGRPMEEMTGELVQGRETIFRMFGDAALPVLAPPWNRLAKAAPAHLAACGIAGLSRFTPRKARFAADGVIEANTHVDLIDWRNGRTGKPPAVVAEETAAHLAARRTGQADPDEATGFLAHHLVMDPTAWRALQEILAKLADDARAKWLTAHEIFEPQPAGAPQ